MAKRKAQPQQDVQIELQFPLEGLDETRAYLRQRPGTCAAAQNVMTFEPGTARARGGMRMGLQAYYPNTDTAAVAGFPIQDINHLVTTNYQQNQTNIGQFTFALTLSSGFGLSSSPVSGSSTIATGLQTGTGFALACSCWDQAGNVYVAEVNATTGVVLLFSYTQAGILNWSNVGPFPIKTGSIRFVCGMVVIGNNLYIATTNTAAPIASVYQVNTASGSVVQQFLYTAMTSAFTNLGFSATSCNCLAAIGTTLGIESAGVGGSTQAFFIVNTTANPFTTAPIVVAYGGVASANRSTVVSDGVGTFYTVAGVQTSMVKAIGIGGQIIWSTNQCDNVIQGMCFDFATGFLMTANTSSPSIRQLNLTNGSLGVSGSPGGILAWNWIDSDGTGKFTVWRNSVASTDIMQFNSTFTALGGPTTFANTIHTGCSVNKGTTQTTTATGSSRVIIGLLVTNGQVRTFSQTGSAAITGGQCLSQSAPVVFSAQDGTNMYFVDGSTYNYYNSLTGQMQPWTPTFGTMPIDQSGARCKLITMWRGRIVMSGLLKDPNNWFMSAINDPFDFNYGPATPTQTQAVAGNASDTGLTGDVITALIPYGDDTMIFGCAQSIWQMTGDPAAGGQFDVISHTLGIAYGRAWAIDLYGQIYFMGNKSGIFKMTPGALPVRISSQIERRLENIDFTQNLVRMAWDVTNQGLWVFITPCAVGSPTINYFFEDRVSAWWPVVFANPLHNPLAVNAFDGDNPQQRVILIGGRDGRLHAISNTATLDDQTPIQWSVTIGPVMTHDLDDVLFKAMQATMGQTSSPVNYDIYIGRSAEQALASTSIWSGTWQPGRNPVSYVRRSGIALYIKVSGTQPAAFEKITATFQPTGKIRRRLP